MMGRIFQAKLMTPADRRFKKAKPGKKKLVKWPKTLEHADVCRGGFWVVGEGGGGRGEEGGGRGEEGGSRDS
jgi:hypothetical protein